MNAHCSEKVETEDVPSDMLDAVANARQELLAQLGEVWNMRRIMVVAQ